MKSHEALKAENRTLWAIIRRLIEGTTTDEDNDYIAQNDFEAIVVNKAPVALMVCPKSAECVSHHCTRVMVSVLGHAAPHKHDQSCRGSCRWDDGAHGGACIPYEASPAPPPGGSPSPTPKQATAGTTERSPRAHGRPLMVRGHNGMTMDIVNLDSGRSTVALWKYDGLVGKIDVLTADLVWALK